jgi:hypothetical protein
MIASPACAIYGQLAVAEVDLSALSSLAIDETSYRSGHSYLTLVADADARKRGADNIAARYSALSTDPTFEA